MSVDISMNSIIALGLLTLIVGILMGQKGIGILLIMAGTHVQGKGDLCGLESFPWCDTPFLIGSFMSGMGVACIFSAPEVPRKEECDIKNRHSSSQLNGVRVERNNS